MVGHYSEQNIFGYCRYFDVYEQVVNYYPDNSHFVEIGCFLGQSTVYMADLIRKSEKTIKFDAIDLFEIGEWSDEPHKQVIEEHGGDFFEAFMKNLQDNKVEKLVNAIKCSSLDAAPHYKDDSLDFVMIDASHKYKDVLADIDAWLPKIKEGGILAGDDYDWTDVCKAVNARFPITKFQVSPGQTWLYKK